MSNSKLVFLFGIHNHQPVGNFEYILEKAYKKSYLPFIEIMAKHPNIKWTLHCSGILWDYFLETKPKYIEIVKSMIEKNQIELLSGGIMNQY